MKSFFSKNSLQYIAQGICFPSFTTLHVEWEPQVVRLQTCVIMAAADQAVLLNLSTEGISLFLFNVYRTLKSLHGTNNKQDGAWVAFSGKNILGQRIVLRRRMICVTKQFPKEFGQGMWQQRVRDKKKEKARTLPLDLRMIRRARKWKRCWNARRAASLRRRTTWISSAWNSFSSHCRERCSYLKKQLVTLFKALFPSYYSGGPSSKQWWHLWEHHAYKLTWAVGRSQYIL